MAEGAIQLYLLCICTSVHGSKDNGQITCTLILCKYLNMMDIALALWQCCRGRDVVAYGSAGKELSTKMPDTMYVCMCWDEPTLHTNAVLK